ncbi:hypothetical protein CN204_04190 [Sinorhizobium meliloti]|uniref:hypothetical protein n=1 Tax=Rhizobium meliloti TaxID=382 RepID=UPI000FD6EDF7|nr:hypothetical protein [Sinorhizobium meliloti]RVH87737.1 hypothetical protein CN204_04190 [Sinorhizobium meliloti]
MNQGDQNPDEHDPNETPPPFILRWVGELALAVLGLIWLHEWVYGYFDWDQLALGIATGAIVMAWAGSTTDNKTPEWLKTKPVTRRKRKT